MKKVIKEKREREYEIEEYDTIKRSLNSEIETFVFRILCKASKSSFRLRDRRERAGYIQHNLPLWCLSGSAAGNFENRLFV